MEERVRAVGHEHVAATHSSTFEVTSDAYLTPSGDCILGIGADRAPADFHEAFVEACLDPDVVIEATIRVGDTSVTVSGRGHEDLTFASERSCVVRTSAYVDDRTVMIDADAAARDLPRPLVERLADGAPIELVLRVDG